MKELLFVLLLMAGLHLSYGYPTITGIGNYYTGIGGSTVVIWGRDFSEDQFSYFNSSLGNVVYFDNGAKWRKCDVIAYKTNREKIECRLEPEETSVNGPKYHVYVYSDGQLADGSGGYLTYYLSYNYRITDITPKTGPPGTLVTLSGSFAGLAFDENPDDPLGNVGKNNLERLEFGGHTCQLRNDLGVFYGISDTELKCKVDSSAVGNFMIEMEVETPYGNVHPNKVHNRLSAQNQLYNFQAYPVIEGMSPSTGSTMGRSVLSITGVGLYNKEGGTRVTVGDRECDLIQGTDDRITCLTPSISEITADTHIPGDRGLLYELWNQYINNLGDDVALNTLFSRSPDHQEIVDSTDVPQESYNGYPEFTARLSGFFIPPHDGEFRLYCKMAALKLYRYRNTTESEKIDSIPYPGRSSKNRLHLKKDETYFIEILHHTSNGQSKVPFKVRLLDYNTKYTVTKVQTHNMEQQRFKIFGTPIKEKQLLDFGNFSSGSLAPNLTFRFVYGNTKSEPLDISELTQEEPSASEAICISLVVHCGLLEFKCQMFSSCEGPGQEGRG